MNNKQEIKMRLHIEQGIKKKILNSYSLSSYHILEFINRLRCYDKKVANPVIRNCLKTFAQINHTKVAYATLNSDSCQLLI